MTIQPWPGMMSRPMHLVFALVVTSSAFPFIKRDRAVGGESLINFFLVLFSIGIGVWYIVNYDFLTRRLLFVTSMTKIQVAVGLALIVIVFDACRRVIGWSLTVVGLAAVLYGFLGPWLPGIFAHGGLPFNRFIELQALSENGIFGVAIMTSNDYLFYFILLSAFMEVTGITQLFMSVALRAVGGLTGGPAKVSVVASGLFGMVSGSAAGNVMGTGVVTIPLMKRYGFRPEFAAGVEAAASTGGQLLPPVMGIGAFVMAEFLGISYWSIAKAAALPALGYFIAVFAMVHIESLRLDLRSKPDQPLSADIVSRLHLTLPLILLVYFLATGYSLGRAAFYSFVAVILVSFLKKDTRLGFDKALAGIKSTGNNAALIAIACGVSGIITGVAAQTGLALRFSSILLSLAGGNFFLVLVYTMLGVIIMGMGMPTVVAYIIGAIIFVPALEQLQIPLLAAHMFVFYFAVLGMVTPPVCLASYAAGSLAKADLMKTGIQGFMLTIPGFVIPFAFVYNNALLLQGTIVQIALAFLSTISGVFVLSFAIGGYLMGRVGVFNRIILILISFMLISPQYTTDVVGYVAFAVYVSWQWFRSRSKGSVQRRPLTDPPITAKKSP